MTKGPAEPLLIWPAIITLENDGTSMGQKQPSHAAMQQMPTPSIKQNKTLFTTQKLVTISGSQFQPKIITV